jgi:hypothetical protein
MPRPVGVVVLSVPDTPGHENNPLKKRILSVVFLNRATRRVLKPTRVRLHSAVAGVAFALLAGLSAPAAAASIGNHPTTDTTATTTVAASTAGTAKTATTKAAATKTAAAWKPSANDLHTAPVSGDQQSLTPTKEQLANAKAIMDAGQKMHLPARAWVIAIATSMQESQLKNIGDLGNANDHDSLGLFQQRPSSGWGTPQQLQDPEYAATAFYKGLVDVKGWNKLPLTDAAQAVQVSAYPDHYAKWENIAGDIVNGFYGSGPYAAQAAHTK